MSLPDFKGVRILVVEDTFLVADLIVEHLTELGCQVVGPAPRVAQALALIAHEKIDGALLDVNLAGEYCFPIAVELTRRNTPFAFLTGYGESGLLSDFRSVPRLAKPYSVGELTGLLSTLFMPKVE